MNAKYLELCKAMLVVAKGLEGVSALLSEHPELLIMKNHTIWIITFKGKPAYGCDLWDIETASGNAYTDSYYKNNYNRDAPAFGLIASRDEGQCKLAYTTMMGGYTWRERAKGVECQRFELTPIARTAS